MSCSSPQIIGESLREGISRGLSHPAVQGGLGGADDDEIVAHDVMVIGEVALRPTRPDVILTNS
jgi:hypothetical protein